MEFFEGYVGIRISENQLTNDVIFLLLLVLLTTFAFIFRTHLILFKKMLKDMVQVKERGNLFEELSGNEFVFGHFMTFQMLFLCSIAAFSMARSQGYFISANSRWLVLTILLSFIIFLLFYVFKQGFYKILGYIFTDADKYKLWKTNYHAITGFWGILLYIPVVWLISIGSGYIMPILLFGFLYFLCRFVIIYNTIRIFYAKKHGFFYISLYLCGQEIIPLVLLYQGLVFLYNFIEASTLWH